MARGPVQLLKGQQRPAAVILGASSILVLVAAACGGGSSSTSSNSTSTSTTASTPSSASGAPKQVTASLTDFHIALSPQPTSPGAYTFVTTNNGKVTHALEINGPGVSGQKTATIQPGQSANLTVNLQSGSYNVFCPVDGHKDLGMNLTMNIGVSGSGAGSSSTTARSSSSGGSGGGY